MKAKDHARVWHEASNQLRDIRYGLPAGSILEHVYTAVSAMTFQIAESYERFAKEQEEQGD